MFNKLYREGEVPSSVKGRGVWQWFGDEYLFSPFGPPNTVDTRDWECECGFKWYLSEIKTIFKSHCPKCGRWIGLRMKFKHKQRKLDDFK